MAKKKTGQLAISQEAQAEAQQIFEHYRQLVSNVRDSTDRQAAEAALAVLRLLFCARHQRAIGKGGAQHIGQRAVETVEQRLFDIRRPDPDGALIIQELAEKAGDLTPFVSGTILQNDLAAHLALFYILLVELFDQSC